MLMPVTVTHDGEPEGDTRLVTSTSDEGSVVLTPGDSADITLSCSCVVLVNP